MNKKALRKAKKINVHELLRQIARNRVSAAKIGMWRRDHA